MAVTPPEAAVVTTRVEARRESRAASAVNSAEAADVATTNVATTNVATTNVASANVASANVAAAEASDMASAALGLCPACREGHGKRRGGENRDQPIQHNVFLLACGGSSATNRSNRARPLSCCSVSYDELMRLRR